MIRVSAVHLAGLLVFGSGPNLLAQGVPDPMVLSLDSLLNTKISSAAKYQQTTSEAASSVTIITAEDIQRHGYQTLPEALAATRGFYLSYDRNYSFLGARGFSRPSDYNNRILLLVDGNATNEGVFGGAPFGTDLGISLSSLERIEIVRGPGSALYGTGAIFAIVNLVTKPADTDPGVYGALRGGSYGARGGSLQYRGSVGHGLGLSLGGNWDGADGHDLFYPEFNSPETNSGVAHDMDWERRWALRGALQGHGFTLHGRYSARTKAIPTGAYDTDLDGDASRTRDDYGFLELQLDRPVDNSRRVTGRAYLNAYRYDGEYVTAGEPSTDGALNEAIGAEAALHWDVASSNRLTVGGEVRRDLRASYFMPRAFPRETDWSLPNTVLSAYLQDEHQLTRSLSVLAGLRHDSYETSDDATSPRLALIFAPAHSSTMKLLYGRAFRAPSPYEAADGGDGYKENPELLPETAQTVEAVWQQRLSTALLASVSLFHYDVRRLIDLTLDPVDSLFQYRNVGDAEAKGFEVELQGRLGPSGTGYVSYSFQDAVDRRTDQWLSNSPRHMLKAGSTADVTRWLGAGMDARYESGRRTLAGTETDPAFISDLHLLLPARSTSSPRGPVDRLELSLRINNLFDASYATPGGVEHRQAAIAQDGRTVSAELRYRF
jgi:outer membrane receptor for ferrienterochelin and colicins